MKNYQLYKTNALLSGQLKWDIIIDKIGDKLYVKDFHLSPISKYVPYNKYSDDSIINYEHRYNIKDFYTKISGYFYETPVSHYMNDDWPIVGVDDKTIIPYDDTYLSGCSRSEFGVYEKPFEYLCPVWLEHINLNEKLAFQLIVETGNFAISTKVLNLDYIDGDDFKYHNKFIDYLYNYLSYVSIYSESGCDDIININLVKKEAYLKGIDATTGNIIISNLSNIIDNLLTRERPLMEFDSFITESFKNTNTIAPNLINFNICFDFDDILSKSVANRIQGDSVGIRINVGSFINKFSGFERTDIYTNYDFIPRQFCGGLYKLDETYNIIEPKPQISTAPNVLDYLKDNKYIDFANKNKAVQKICHWQLVDNDNYIFNLYDGFGGYVEIEDKGGVITQHLISHRYANAPDMYQSVYNKELNNVGWINTFELNESKYRYIISNYQDLINKGYITKIGNGWTSSVKFNSEESIYIILGHIIDDKFDLFNASSNSDSIYIDGLMIQNLGANENVLFISSKDINKLTFVNIAKSLSNTPNIQPGSYGNVINIYGDMNIYEPPFSMFAIEQNILLSNIDNYISDHTLNIYGESISMGLSNVLKKINNIFNSIVQSPLIILNNSLYISLADSPSLSSSEIVYYKRNNIRNYLIRYDGKIKPCFGYGDNYIYYKINNKSDDINTFRKYGDSGYSPLFQSIGFYAYKSEILNYDVPSNLINKNFEYKWFGKNKYIHTQNEFDFQITSDTDNINDINQKILEYFKDKFNFLNKSDDYYQYIISLYNIKYNLMEYNNSQYIYNIYMILK